MRIRLMGLAIGILGGLAFILGAIVFVLAAGLFVVLAPFMPLACFLFPNLITINGKPLTEYEN